MGRHSIEGVFYAPLYIHHFQLLIARHLVEAEKFNCIDPLALVNTSDKLRFYRHKKALFQRDVADYAGIDRSTYIRYENDIDYYQPHKLAKIAELLDVGISDLVDDYNAFLYQGQGQQIRNLRETMKLTQKEFGKHFGVHAGTVKRWESDKIHIF
jgi:transcriptional regulator with XRE-family HTH domain